MMLPLLPLLLQILFLVLVTSDGRYLVILGERRRFFEIGIGPAVPAVLLCTIGSGQDPLGTLHGETHFMQDLADMARMVLHPKLLLHHPSNHGRGPHSRIQAIGDRTTVEDIAQLFALPGRQPGGSAGALTFEQALHAMSLIASQPFRNLGTRGLQNFGQLPAGASLRVQQHGLQTLGHPVSSIAFGLLAQANQPLIGARMQSQDSWKHAVLLERVWHVYAIMSL